MARLLLRDLTPGTAYKLQLRAADGDSFSDWSRLFNLATSSDVTAPDVPAWATAGTEWVVNGDTFVATWVALNMTLPNNVDFDHYELELTDGVKSIVVATNNTSYTLTYDQNRVWFGTAKATVLARVRSVDHVGNASAWSTQKSATNPPPGNVASITTTALLESIKIDWPAVSDLDLVGYKVQVSTTSASTGFTDIYNGPNLSVLHGTVQFLTDHWFRVYAVDKFGSISAAPVTSGAVRPKSSFTVDTTPPNTPTSLAAVLTNNANGIGGRAAVTWNLASPPTDLAGFYVRYRKVGDTVWAVASFPSDNTGVAGSFAGTINVDSAYTNYEFAIKAYDWSNNESAWSSTVTATAPGNAIPANVTGLVSTAGKDSIVYSWTPVADLDIKNYEVTFSTSPSFASGNITYLTGTSTTLTVGGLSTGTTYYARVRAVDTAGNPSAAWTATDTDTTGTFPTASSIVLTSTTAALNAPSGGGATTPATAVVTGTPTGTTITVWEYSVDGAAFSASVPTGVSRTGNVVTITGSTMTARTITVRMADATGLAGTFTVSKTLDGAAGSNGTNGTNGTNGVGVSSTAVTYQVHTSGTTAPTGTWTSSVPSVPAGQFLWTRTITTYTDASTSTAYSVGAAGANGSNGTNGRGISSTSVTYQVHTSGTSAPTGTWTSSVPSVPAGQFLWTRTIYTYTDSTTDTAYSVAGTGTQGPAGPAGPASDGQVPGTGTTPDVLSGLSYLYVKWAPVTTNVLGAAQSDPVTYEVHLSTTTGFTPSAGTKVTEVSGTSAIIDNLPGTNTALSYSTTYYVKIVPKDRDGSGAASAQGSGTISKVASTDVTSIGADLIVPGTGFVNALVVNSGGSIQSSNWTSLATGWKISPTGIEMNDTGSKIKADAIITGNLGGPAGVNSVLTIASNTSIVMNGGHLKSNTYNGTGGAVTYDPNATAGFYLGNDGLVIAQGAIKAEAFAGGTFAASKMITLGDASTDGVLRSYDYGTSGGTTGFSLSKSGLIIKTGQVEAAALKIQVGANIMPVRQSSWDGNISQYSHGNGFYVDSGGMLAGANATGGKFGPQKFGAIWSAQAVPLRVYLANSLTDYNIPTEAGKTYIFSLYAYASSALSNVLKIKWSNGTIVTLDTKTLDGLDSPATATRLTGVATAPAGTTGCIMIWENPNLNFAGGISLDGAQVEEKVSSLTTPSSWTPPGYTSIHGSMITTGSIQSTTPALDVNGNAISGVQAWQINTAGNAVFGDVLIRGKMVMGTSADYNNSTTIITDADGNAAAQEDTDKMAGIGSMQSYNYSPGVSGWSIRSNGYAEFLQLKANSIRSDAIEALSPDKLNPGTMTADVVIGATMRSVEKDTLYVTNKSRTGSTVILTLATSHTRLIGDRVQVKLDTPDANIDTPGKVFATVTAITDTTISYTHPNGGSVTVGSAAATGTLYVEGRSVQMSPEGVTLFQNNGIDRIIDLPTDTLLPAYFAGDVEANSLTVKDDFLLQGIDNAVAAGGVFTLNASVVAPSGTPTFNFSWDYVSTWLTNDYTAWKSGLWLDAGRYITSNAFFGAQVFGVNPDGSFNFNLGVGDDSGGEGHIPFGVIKAADGKFYVLVNDSGDGLWKVRRYAASGTGFDTLESTWTYNEATYFGVTAKEWKVDGWNGSALKDPVIGYGTPDGTNYYIYIARCNKAGRIIVSRYTTAGTLQANVTTNITDNQNLKGINVGAFDYGSYRWVVTTEGNSAKVSNNYVFSTAGTHQSTESFPNPNNYKMWGLCWNGTAFVGLTQNNRLYTYTALANTGVNVWYAKSTFFKGTGSTNNVSAVSGNGTTSTITTSVAHGKVAGDTIYVTGTLATALNGAYYTVVSTPLTTTLTVSAAYSGSVAAGGTISNEWETPLSTYATSTVTRRAKLTISSSNIPVGSGSNQPDRARFYFSTTAGGGGSYYRQTNSNPTVSQVWTTNPTFSGTATTQTAFPAGTPAKIVSNNGKLELNSNGYAVFGSTADVNNLAGNTPALRTGDINGLHLRIDGNEIMCMNTNTSQGTLTLNAGAQTNTTNLSVSGTVVSDLNVSGAVLATQRVQSDTGLFDTNYATAGTTTAQYNTNGRVIKSASSKRYKKNIEPMSLEMAKTTLAIEPVTYEWIDKDTYGEGRFPGVIAEQAHEVGAYPWVNYRNDLDEEGNLVPDGFRYGEVTAAHNMLIKDLYEQIETLKAELKSLKG